MSYRTSVVKVPDYSSSSFSTEGFSVYKNVQTGICINLSLNIWKDSEIDLRSLAIPKYQEIRQL